MKILKIRLKNLNSLKGDHHVDFTKEPLASAGLFAITGHTGAGKSTLLDAITLALYGRAARYGSESNPEHVMSRHTGECEAEVVFEVPSGVFRAVWQRHRARKKPEGVLQQPKRYVYNQIGQELAQQITEANQKIEGLIGLDYDRFLRSVLLAQGEFSKFLKSNENERAELLESLTGTDIYSRLGSLAHAEATRRENELRMKELGLEHIEILSGQERSDLESALGQMAKEQTELAAQINDGSTMLAKIARLEEARKKEKSAAIALEKSENQTKGAADDLDRLRRHMLTLPFTELLARYDAAESALAGAKTTREEAELNHAKALKALYQANHDFRISIESSLHSLRKQVEEFEQKATSAAKEVAQVREWLNEHQQDASLTETMGDLISAIEAVKNLRSSLAEKWRAWRKQALEIIPDDAERLPEIPAGATTEEFANQLNALLELAGLKQSALKAAVVASKKQLDLREDHLGKARLIAKLEDHRHALSAGEPCPLCGALEHPYAKGAAPDPKIAELEAEVIAAKGVHNDATDELRTHTDAVKSLAELRPGLLDGLKKHELHVERLRGILEPFNADLPEPGDEYGLKAELQGRERDYRKQLKALEEAGKQKDDAERIVQHAAGKAEELENKRLRIQPLPPDYTGESIPRQMLKPASEVEEIYIKAVQEEKTTKAQIDFRISDHDAAKKSFMAANEQLTTALKGSEFSDIDNVKKTRIRAHEAEKLEALKRNIEKASTEAKALLTEARSDIAGLLGEHVFEGEAAESFKARQAALTSQRDQLLQDQASCRDKIIRDDKSRKNRDSIQQELAVEQAALTVWKRLRELIGSADGAKFRRYAQAITLDILTRHANRHLIKLSDRYRICRDGGRELTLEVEDLHQAGVRRPMASLSGGESFLVSLALALGLSDLAGRKVRIDSLFVDEGFGSLDPETLEVAIAALESLQQKRKSVGVISHVGLLKERISTQVVVEKLTGGESRISVVS